jgi:hypothetical protein
VCWQSAVQVQQQLLCVCEVQSPTTLGISRLNAQVTAAQQHYLRILRAKPAELQGLSKDTATALITQKLAEREQQPPTAAQLKLLQTLDYHGVPPNSKCSASKIIDDIKRTRRLTYLRRKALHKGIDIDTLRRLEQFVVEHEL